MYYFLRINYSPDITGQDVGVGAAELGPRGKFRYIFTAKFTAYCS